MKVIINNCYGGFGVKDSVLQSLGYSSRWDSNLRTDARAIAMVENGEDIASDYAELTVVTLPDNCTDYHIEEYDGMESVIYVVDGKLHWYEGEEE